MELAVHHFRHVVFRSRLLDVQRQIRSTNGRNGLWLVGMYTGGADYHESAVRSALRRSVLVTALDALATGQPVRRYRRTTIIDASRSPRDTRVIAIRPKQ